MAKIISCDHCDDFKGTLPEEQCQPTTTTINHSSPCWGTKKKKKNILCKNVLNLRVIDVERDNTCTQKTKGEHSVFAAGISQCVLEMSLRHSRTWSRSQSRSGLCGNAASGQESGWNVFWLQQVDSSGWKQTASSFSPQLTDSLPPHRLLLFGRKQSSSLFSPPDPHTKPLPGGCCCRNQVQAFDPSPDHWLKGCHFNFRPCSIPRCSSSIQSPGDTLFLKSPSRVLSHRSRLPRCCEDNFYSHPPRLSVEWMQVNNVGHKTTTAFVSVTLTTSGHNESNKNGWNLKWTTKKKSMPGHLYKRK